MAMKRSHTMSNQYQWLMKAVCLNVWLMASMCEAIINVMCNVMWYSIISMCNGYSIICLANNESIMKVMSIQMCIYKK